MRSMFQSHDGTQGWEGGSTECSLLALTLILDICFVYSLHVMCCGKSKVDFDSLH